jgi:hypothetical protein
VIEAASLIGAKEAPIMNTKTLDLEYGFSGHAVIQGGSPLAAAMLVPGVSFAGGAGWRHCREERPQTPSGGRRILASFI